MSVQDKVEGKRFGAAQLRLALALCAAVLMLVVAACGDDSDSGGGSSASSGGGGNAAQSEDAAKSGEQTVSAGVSDYADYIGAKSSGAADSSKSPITIGWVNQQGGPADVGPGSTDGAEFAVQYLNEKLGGIDGHPVKLFKCYTSTSEEQGQTCGQKMANNKDVKVVAVGAVAIGDQSLTATIGGAKPMVYSVAIGPSAPTNKNGYALFGDGIRVSGPFATYAKDVVKAKTAAIVWPDNPGIAESSKAIVDGAKKVGITAKGVSWSQSATDLVGPLTAAGGQSADVIITNSDPKGCVNLAKAIDQLKIKTPVVSEPLCINETVSKALGDFPKWTYGIASTLASDMADPTAQAYAKVVKELNKPAQYSQDVWIPTSFHEMLTIFQWMNKIGPDNISEQTIQEQAKAFKGPQAWGAPTLQCGKNPARPAICNDQTKFYKYEGKGKLTVASGWLGPPS
jgi:branched-chain amino acid transport system substrate-binding protein